jgi:hypothetical protein
MWTSRQTKDWPVLDSSSGLMSTFGVENLRDCTGQENYKKGDFEKNSVRIET